MIQRKITSNIQISQIVHNSQLSIFLSEFSICLFISFTIVIDALNIMVTIY